MSNPFQLMFDARATNEEKQEEFKMPDKLKDAVFSTLDATSLIADMVDLFTVKLIQSQSELLDTLPNAPYGSEEAEKQKLFDYFLKRGG